MNVAALYVARNGAYPVLLGPESCWTKERDAKSYVGPGPVICHPDCGPWSKLRHLCTKQDASCGQRAVSQVQAYRGVLEHPEHSLLFDYWGLPKPGDATDRFGGRTYYCEQVDWGHPCAKPTWLYIVGADQQWVMRQLRKRRGTGKPTHCVCTGPRQLQRLPVASHNKKILTPRPFAELLISIARNARRVAA